MKSLIALFAALCFIPAAHADYSQSFGDVEVHYNALSTDDLSPEVAKSYKLDRSRDRGLLTVSVLRKNKLGVAEPITAEVKAHMVNLNAQLSGIDLREIKEGPAIYYLGEFRMSRPETLTFTLEVKPAGSARFHKVEFQHKFYR